jgi:hypothetical protein
MNFRPLNNGVRKGREENQIKIPAYIYTYIHTCMHACMHTFMIIFIILKSILLLINSTMSSVVMTP